VSKNVRGDGYFSQMEMNASADVIRTRDMLVRLEIVEADRAGISIEEIRPILARKIRMSIGSLANIRRPGRRKSVSSTETGIIRAALISALQHVHRAIEHEIHLHIQAGADPRDDNLAMAQAALHEAKEKLKSAMR
jgi:hypothetical protein